MRSKEIGFFATFLFLFIPIFATWNARTLSDTLKANHPERRTGILSNHGSNPSVEIAAFSKNIFPGAWRKRLCFLWKTADKSTPNKIVNEVKFAKIDLILSNCQKLPERDPINTITIQYAYIHAPTLKSPTKVKELLYQDPKQILSRISNHERINLKISTSSKRDLHIDRSPRHA